MTLRRNIQSIDGVLRRNMRSFEGASMRNVREIDPQASFVEKLQAELGSLAFAFYPASDPEDILSANRGMTIATGVSSWPDAFESNGALAEATGSKQPVLSATSYNGRPGVTFDGSDDQLIATLSPTMAINSRFYVWMLAQWTSTTQKDFGRICEIGDVAGYPDVSSFQANTDVSGTFGAFLNLTDGADNMVSALTMDTDPHLWEMGALTVTANKTVEDGTGYNGSETGTTDYACNRFSAGNRVNAAGREGAMRACGFLIAHDTGSISSTPSASQISAVRSILNYVGGL